MTDIFSQDAGKPLANLNSSSEAVEYMSPYTYIIDIYLANAPILLYFHTIHLWII